MATIADLVIKLRTDSAGAVKGLTSVGSTLGKVGKTAAIAAGAAGLGAIAITLKEGIGEWQESTKVSAQTDAVLKSTGKSAHVTAGEVGNLANSIMRKTGIDDEAIQSGENMLLTFTNVRNEVGKGNDIFNQATHTIVDMSTALGQDMSSSAIQLGKALNDPVKGITALQRVGVSFTAQQREQIKALVESGHTMEAQKIILRELNKEFGGSAEAIGKTLPGKIALLRQEFSNFAGSVVGAAVPALQSFVDFIQRVVDAPSLKAKVEVVLEGAKNLVARAAEIAGQIAAGIQARLAGTDWGAVGAQIGAAISAGFAVTADFMDKVMGAILGWVSGHIGQIADVGATMAIAIVGKLTDPAFWVQHWQITLGIMLVAFTDGLGKLAPLASKIGLEIVTKFAFALAEMAPRATTVVLKLVGIFEAMGPKLAALVATAMVAVVRAVVEKADDAAAAAGKVAKAIIDRIHDWLSSKIGQAVLNGLAPLPMFVLRVIPMAIRAAIDLGRAIIEGVISGIESLAGAVAAKLESVVMAPINAAKGMLRINSPSKLTRDELGIPIAEGIILGMTDGVAIYGPQAAASLNTFLENLRDPSFNTGKRVGHDFVEGIRQGIAEAFTQIGQQIEDSIYLELLKRLRRAMERIADNIAQNGGVPPVKGLPSFPGSNPNTPPYAPAPSGPNLSGVQGDGSGVTVNVYGSVWDKEALAGEVASAMYQKRYRGGLSV